eukprot:gene6176-7405_t
MAMFSCTTYNMKSIRRGNPALAPAQLWRPPKAANLKKRATPVVSVASASDAFRDVLVLALDVGTTGLKACVVRQDGKVLGTGSAAYRHGTSNGTNGEVEQCPEDWAQASVAACRQALAADPADMPLAAVVFSGQMQDLVPVAAGRSLSNALLYSDSRAQAEYTAIVDLIGSERLNQEALNVKGAASVLAKWLWMQEHQHEVLGSAEALLLGAHSYLAYRYTGGLAACCDRTTAATTGLLAPPALRTPRSPWCSTVLHELSLEQSKLPTLVEADAQVGTISPAAARELGLPRQMHGLPVYHGAGDLGCTALGAGAAEHMYVGTSGWIARTEPETSEDPTSGMGGLFTVLHPDDGLTLRFLPHLSGERSPFTDPQARGAFIGLSGSSTKSSMTRAVLEGVALNFRSMRDLL